MKNKYLQILIAYFLLLSSNCLSQINWTASNSGLSSNSYVNDFALSSNGDIYIIVNSGGQGQLLKSINNGISWVVVTTQGLPLGGWAGSLFIKDNKIFLGTGGLGSYLYTSTDGGQNWIASNSGLPLSSYVNDFGITNNGDVFTIINSNQQGYLYKSTDNGATWIKQIVNGLPIGGWANSFFIKNNKMFIGTGNLGTQIYSSTDNGENWISTNYGLPVNSYVNDFGMTSNGDIYTILNSNLQSYIYKSTNNGSLWINQTVSGLPANGWANSFFIKNNTMFIGTGNTGSQLYVSSVSTGIDNLDNNLVFSMFPNPSNGNIAITSQLKIDLIKITTISGHTIYELKPNDKVTSFHFDENGTYLLTITSGGHTFTKKIIVKL
jgi:hypothetical protein